MKTTPSRSRAIAVNRPNRFAQFVAISVLSVGTLIACVGALRADDSVIIAQTFTTLGSPKYPADFAHFDYVNPEAPKGGEISFAAAKARRWRRLGDSFEVDKACARLVVRMLWRLC